MQNTINVLTPHEVFEKCKTGDTVLLDIRENKMLGYEKFDVPKQFNISIKELYEKWIILPLNKLIVVADSSEISALKSAEFLLEHGFRVAVLAGGTVEWEREGLSFIKNCYDNRPNSCSCQHRHN